jgi:hypothetical protein
MKKDCIFKQTLAYAYSIGIEDQFVNVNIKNMHNKTASQCLRSDYLAKYLGSERNLEFTTPDIAAQREGVIERVLATIWSQYLAMLKAILLLKICIVD